jgi:rSAM/selenodomain-associated transferase 1
VDKSTTIVVMAKKPRIGYTKTRLVPPFTFEQAAQLYEALLLDTLELVSRITDVQLTVAITPGGALDYFERITAPGTLLISVDGADIGECLIQATGDLLSSGFKKVIALNADGPSLPIEYLILAIHSLGETDVVLGPGEDGGYYLVGLKKPTPQLFQEINWSTPQVLEQTLTRAKTLNLKVDMTPPWYDVDTGKEAGRLETELDLLPPDRLVHTRRFFEIHPPTEWLTV